MNELEKEYLTPLEVEVVYGLSRAMLAKSRHEGSGPRYYKANRQIRYRRDDIETWLGDPKIATQCQSDGGTS